MGSLFVQLAFGLIFCPATLCAGRWGFDDAAALVQVGPTFVAPTESFDESGAPISRARLLMLTRRHEAQVAAAVAERTERLAARREASSHRGRQAEGGKQGFISGGVANLFRRKSKVMTNEAFLETVQEVAKAKVDLNDRANATVRARFYAAPAGQDCPNGWATIVDKDICKEAANTLGGHDNTNWEHAWSGKPAGCFYHTPNENVNFNMNPRGQLNENERRFCENSTVFYTRIYSEFRAEKQNGKSAQEQEQAEEAEIDRLRSGVQKAVVPDTVKLGSTSKKKYNARKAAAPQRRASSERRAELAAAREKREAAAEEEEKVDAALELVNTGRISADELLAFEAR